MTRHVLSPAVVFSVAFLGLIGCGEGGSRKEKNDGAVRVISYSPQTSIDSAETITIRFDKPVVEPSQVAKAAEGVVAIKPTFAWKAYWHDAKTLVIDPTGPMASSTTYQVALAGEL